MLEEAGDGKAKLRSRQKTECGKLKSGQGA